MVSRKQQSSRKKHVKEKSRKSNPVSSHDAEGREILDPTPLVIPAGFTNSATHQRDELAQMIYEMRRREEEANYIESPEEADDFDEPDPDGDLLFSQYEVQELQEEVPLDLQVSPESTEGVSQAERPETEEGALDTAQENSEAVPSQPAAGRPAS